MKLNLRKMSNLRVALITVASVILCIGILAAEEVSDFEKLLQEALQSNQSEDTVGVASTKVTTKETLNSFGTSRTKLREPVPIKSVVKPLPPEPVEATIEAKVDTTNVEAKVEAKVEPKTMVKAAEPKAEPKIEPKAVMKAEPLSEPKTALKVEAKAESQMAANDGGWTAIKPNDPGKTPKSGFDQPLRVANASRLGIDPNASVWDAIPITITNTDTEQGSNQKQGNQQRSFENPSEELAVKPIVKPAEKTVEKAVEKTIEETKTPTATLTETPDTAAKTVASPSPASVWDSVIDDVKTTEEPAPIDWNTIARGRIGDEVAEIKAAETKPVETKTAETKLAEEKVTEKEEKEPVAEPETEPVKESEKNSEVVLEKKEEKVTEKAVETTKPAAKAESTKAESTKNSSLDDDMNLILNSLAKESQEEKEVEKKAEKKNKPEIAKKPDEKSNEKQEEKSADKKSDFAQKLDELSNGGKNETLTEPKPLEMTKHTPSGQQTTPDFDSEDDETVWKVVDASKVGDPHSKDKIKLMYDEIMNGLKSRNITGRYDMWKNYARTTLRNAAGLNTGSELDGRCRLSWYQQLYNEPIQSIFAVEEYSRKLHHALSGSHRHLGEVMPDIRKKMDVPERNDAGIRFLECKTPFDAINEVKRCLLEAQMAHARALSTLTTAEQNELAKNIIPTFVGPGCVNGHTIPNRTYGRRLVDIMEKINKAGMYDAAEALIPLTNTALLALLDKLPDDAFPTVMINGQKVQRFSTSAGDILIGGRENNIYDLDSPDMKDVVCIIDLGGNDIYREGTCDLDRPVFAVIDLHGKDTYTGSKPGIQGGSILGVSILIDVEGDDTYSAADIAQGSTIGGAGMLFDFDGNDNYKAMRRVQGHALEGLGMLVDRKGSDKYRASMWAQGFGAPGGFGVLEDSEGNDHYYCGGLYLDSYPEHPGYDGWGQGIGAGIRQVANGGIGAILDGDGDDVYEVDYFGHGGGYWLGVGFARDFGGNDIRHGTTKAAYAGGPRQQQEWTRFANGFGCHYSLGYCFDDDGDDTYGGRIMGTGMAWDLSIGYLCDFNGNDKFTATGGMTQGVGAEGSIGILFSYGGNDQFLGRNQAYSSSNITYHLPSNCGGNFSFLINYGGNDKYGCGAANNSYVQRGSQGGFLIDRPTDAEAATDLETLKETIAKRNQEIAEYDEAVKKATEEAKEKGRRYVPRQRRPLPISADQQQRLGAVPSFDNGTKTGAGKANIK